VPFFSLIFANRDLSKLSYDDNNNNFLNINSIEIPNHGYLGCDLYPNSTLSTVCKQCIWTSIKYYLYGSKVAAMDDCTLGPVDKLC